MSMDEVLIIRSLGIVSEAKSPQLKRLGIAVEKAEAALITYQIS